MDLVAVPAVAETTYSIGRPDAVEMRRKTSNGVWSGAARSAAMVASALSPQSVWAAWSTQSPYCSPMIW